jgi:hypothetical protein
VTAHAEAPLVARGFRGGSQLVEHPWAPGLWWAIVHEVAGAGGLAGTPDVMRRVVGMGVRFVTAGIEWDFMMAAASQRVALLRGLPLG